MKRPTRRGRLGPLGQLAGVVLCFAPAARSAPVLTDVADIKVSVGGSEVENHVAIEPGDPNVLVVSNIRDATAISTWLSQDAGRTWKKLQPLIPDSVDPIGAINPAGRFLLSHLHNLEVAVDYKDTMDSTVAGTRVIVEPFGIAGWDKNFLWVINRIDPQGHYPAFCGFSDADLAGDPDAPPGRVQLHLSPDDGANWDTTRIHVDAGATVGRHYVGIALATAPDVDNVIYAAWASREATVDQPAKAIMFRYSTNGGVTQVSPAGGQTIMSLQGFDRHDDLNKGMRITVSPSMTVAGNGDTYVVFADREAGHGDSDIYILKSEDRGVTWKMPGGTSVGYKRVNGAGGTGLNRDQWFPWITWDDGANALIVVYYDSRDDPNSLA